MLAPVILSLICIACAYLCWTVADKRGANTKLWAIMGALFGPLAIPFVLLLKKKPPGSDR
jgi:hypothetical protein